MEVQTKLCTRGGHEAPVTQFSINRRTSDGLQHWCKPCFADYERERYHAGDKVRKRRNAKAHVDRVRKHLWDYLSEHACVDCGEDNVIKLEFDHVDPDSKLGNVSEIARSSSWKTVLAEISKCEVRCANCHRVRTGGQFGWWKVGYTG